MVNILNKVKMPHFNRFVWWGSGVGMFISVLGGVGIVAGYYAASNALMSYRDKAAFSGTFSLIAALFLSALAVQFLRFKDVEVKYRKKMADKTQAVKSATQSSAALSMSTLQMWNDPELKDTSRSIFVLCLAAVLREGLECFVFLGPSPSSPSHPRPLEPRRFQFSVAPSELQINLPAANLTALEPPLCPSFPCAHPHPDHQHNPTHMKTPRGIAADAPHV